MYSSALTQNHESDDAAMEEQCLHCFDVILSHLFSTPPPPTCFPGGDFPLFVTWNKADPRGGYSLRGCIGNLSPMDILVGVRKYAAVAAFEDGRFSPIAAHEVTALQCGVTLLHSYEQAAHYLDWVVGTHGVMIEFEDDHGRRLSATYLPQVCPEQGWEQEECIDSLVRKAGFHGRIDARLRGRIRLTRYQGCKYSVDFASFRQRRTDQGRWHPSWRV